MKEIHENVGLRHEAACYVGVHKAVDGHCPIIEATKLVQINLSFIDFFFSSSDSYKLSQYSLTNVS